MNEHNDLRIRASGGEIFLQSDPDRIAYDRWHYAPARRAGDYVYLSGVVVASAPDGPRTPETFRTAARQAFERVGSQLRAHGATFSDVVMLNTFHDWSAPEFAGDRAAQAESFKVVKAEFMPPPHPAWTAVGTSGLVRPEGIMEIQMIAFSPLKSS